MQRRAQYTEGFEARRSWKGVVLWQIRLEYQYVEIEICDMTFAESLEL